MSIEATRRLFDVDEYHRMGEAGILREEDRVELIDGEILRMSPIGPRHSACTDRANRILSRLVGDDAIVRVQGSVRLSPYREPEPDLLLLRPREDFYASRFAGPADVLLVMEISETSLTYDRITKARLYAEAAIPDYWLLDLNSDLLEVYRDPADGRYASRVELTRGQSVAPQAFPALAVTVDSLLG